MANTATILQQFDSEIRRIYEEQNLTSLSVGGSFVYKKRQLLSWFYDVIQPLELKGEAYKRVQQIFDGLVYCSDHYIYALAHLFLYRPFIENILQNGHEFYGETVFPRIQTVPGKRYDMFVEIAYQKLYNCWDRIGDLLAASLSLEMEDRFCNFQAVIDRIGGHFQNDENYNWLKNFKEGEYVLMN